MTYAPTPTNYADPLEVHRVVGKKESDAASADVILRACQDATQAVIAATGRRWCVDPDADPVPLTYNAPLAQVLLVDDLVSTEGVAVQLNGGTVDPATYTWARRTIYGDAPHVYAVRLTTGTWWALAATAGVDPHGAVTLTGVRWGTSLTPPGPIQRATERIAVALYKQRAATYQHQSTGSEDLGIAPPPDTVIPADTLAVLGPYVHPRRPLGRP